MLLNPLYTAPLPAGFTSGTVEIKSPGTYVDQAGRVQQPSYRFSINADGSLTSLQVGGASSIVGMGVGDRSNAPNVDVVIELRVAGSPVPFRTTYNMVPFDSGSGTLRLQQEKQTAPVIVTASVISNLSNQTALYVMGTENISIGGTSLAIETFQPVAPASTAASVTAAASAAVAPVKSAIGNTALSQLSAKGTVDGPQFIGSQRFDRAATGTPDGGTVVASNDGGFWVMDLSAGVVTPDLFGGDVQLALNSPNVTVVEVNRNISVMGVVVPAGKALRGRGGTITVPSGTYATPVGFTASWCVRLAAGAVAENLILAGNKANAGNVIGIYVEGGSGITARRNTVTNFSLDGIRFRGATDFLIESNSVVGCERSAIEAEIGARGRIRGNRVEDCRDGIKWWGGDGAVSDTIGISDLTIDANTVLNVGRPGLLAGGVWGSLGQRVTVSNNVISGANDVGIDFENCKDSSATGNIVKDCVNAGLANFYGGDNIQFTGNTVTQGNGAPAYKGFGGKTASNINLSNNSLITTGGIAVQTDGAGVIQNLQISGGTIRNTGAFPAVRLLESPRPSLTDVRITTENKVAVQIEGCDKFNVKNCNILTSAALGGAADTVSNSGGVRAVWRSVTYKGQMGAIQNCEIRGFQHSISDDNGGDYYSGLFTSGNRLSGDILHYAAVAAGYRGYHDPSNRNADNPTSGVTENAL